MADQPDPSKDETNYESSSKTSFKSIYRQNEAEMDVVPAASLSSDYKSAEPYMSQQPGYEVQSYERAGEYRPSIDVLSLEKEEANVCRYV